MKVCIDPGHGGTDPGAVGNKLFEKDITLNICKYIKSILQDSGHTGILTRSVDKTMNLQPRVNIANKNDCDLFLSIHCNSAGIKTAKGFETWIYPHSKTSNKFAKCVQSELAKSFEKHINRGVKSANFYVLRNTQMPAILVECEFINNPAQEKFLNSITNQKKIARSIVNGIIKSI